MKPFNLSIIFGAAVALLGLAGCRDDIHYIPDRPDMQGVLTVPFEVDGEMPVSRGVAPIGMETNLSNVYILFFDTRQDEKYVAYRKVGVLPGKTTISFDPPESLVEDRDYRILAVGNADPYHPSGNFAETLSRTSGNYTSVIGELTATSSAPITDASATTLPMFGLYQNSEGSEEMFRVSSASGAVKVESKGSFKFARSVCRFDIHNLVGHMLRIESARVINGRNAGFYFMDGLNAGSQPELRPVEAPSGEGYRPCNPIEEGKTTQRMQGRLYGFPNSVNTSVVNDRLTTSLMIAGHYVDNSDPANPKEDAELTYYRFNLANAGEAQVLQRNYCYVATIKGVKRRGATTEEEAYNDSSPIFEYQVEEEWKTSDDNVATDSDGNFLIVNKTHLTFAGDVSEADFVELRVSTNPELGWEAVFVDEPGHSNDKFTFERLGDANAIKCGPTHINDTPYIRYGYIVIKARNPETGKQLSMPVYLMQTSLQNNIKTLTVNGCTGRFTQQLDPYGTKELALKVVTGSAVNRWRVYDDDNELRNWASEGISYTDQGGDGTEFVLQVPANISEGPREATLRFALDDEDNTNPDGTKKVADVFLTVVQDNSPQLLQIVGYPSNNQTVRIDCLSLEFANPNCVVNPRSFRVVLADPANMAYKVSTDFDKNRDLKLALFSGSPSGIHPLKSNHPADGSVQKDDLLEDLTSGTSFWINPFRMGPSDPTIKGTVTVSTYRKDDPDKTPLPMGTLTFNVHLYVSPTEIDDVVIKGNYTYLIADRNQGAPSRYSKSDNIYCEADWCTNITYFRITGKQKPSDCQQFFGEFPEGYDVDNWYTSGNGLSAQRLPSFIEDNSHLGKWYTDNDRWQLIPYALVEKMPSRCCVTKGRTFLVSEYKKLKGADYVPVVCWFPLYYGEYHQIGYYPHFDKNPSGHPGFRVYPDYMPTIDHNGLGTLGFETRYTPYFARFSRTLKAGELEEYIEEKHLIAF